MSGQLARDAFVRLSREFAELSPIVETVKTYRATAKEIADLESMMSDPSTGADMRQIAEAELLDLQARRDKLEQDIRVHLIPKDAMDDRNVILEIRAGTGGDEASLFAGGPVPDVRTLRRQAGLEDGDHVRKPRQRRRLQGDHRRNPRARRLLQAEIRIRRASGAARAGDGSIGPRAHLRRDGRGPARGRRRRRDHQRAGSEDRHPARQRRRRPARQQDQIRDPAHPPANRDRDRDAGGPLPAPQQGQGDGGTARAALRA